MEKNKLKKKLNAKKLLEKYEKPFYQKLINFILLNIGFTISALGYVYFFLPNKIVNGGAGGVATVLFHTFEFNVSITLLTINIFLILLQLKVLGRFSSYKTLYVILVQPLVIQFLLKHADKTQITDDKMLACLFGGVLTGIGIGIVFKVGGTTGGTDILARIVAKYLRISVGRALTVIDFSIALSSGVFLGNLELALYGIISIFFLTRIIDIIQQGLNYSKVVYIISPQYMIIAEALMGDLQRGATLVEVQGMYTQKDKKMIMIVINKRQIFRLKEIIDQFDPAAFTVVCDAYSVMGNGFRRHPEMEH